MTIERITERGLLAMAGLFGVAAANLPWRMWAERAWRFQRRRSSPPQAAGAKQPSAKPLYVL